MTDGDLLLKTIAENPDDDTTRLVFADYLQENGEADRAEFIRLQCRIARLQRGCWCAGCRPDGQHHNGPCAVDKERDELPDGWSQNAHLRKRENELRYAHPEWSQAKCPVCGGKGAWADGPLCRICAGTGDLLVATNGDAHAKRTVQFRRGFIDSVSCELSEVLGPEAGHICRTCRNEGHVGRTRRRCPACAGGGGLGVWVVQPWAKAIMKACPTITHLIPVSYEPHPTSSDYARHLADRAREAARES